MTYIIAPVNEGRLGKTIAPRNIVWHYTAMLPHTEMSLVRVWGKSKGRGTAAHALIRRNGDIVCFAPFNRNTNHAGGATSGVITFNKVSLRANSSSVGIELSNPGRIQRDATGWRLAYTGLDRVYLNEFDPEEIVTDEALGMFTKRDTWGWVDYTQAQKDAARKIARMAWEYGVTNKPCTVVRKTVHGVVYKDIHTTRMCLRHSDMDPSRKSDPGPLWVPQAVMQPEYVNAYKNV